MMVCTVYEIATACLRRVFKFRRTSFVVTVLTSSSPCPRCPRSCLRTGSSGHIYPSFILRCESCGAVTYVASASEVGHVGPAPAAETVEMVDFEPRPPAVSAPLVYMTTPMVEVFPAVVENVQPARCRIPTCAVHHTAFASVVEYAVQPTRRLILKSRTSPRSPMTYATPVFRVFKGLHRQQLLPRCGQGSDCFCNCVCPSLCGCRH